METADAAVGERRGFTIIVVAVDGALRLLLERSFVAQILLLPRTKWIIFRLYINLKIVIFNPDTRMEVFEVYSCLVSFYLTQQVE